jgi:hypothetical protein
MPPPKVSPDSPDGGLIDFFEDVPTPSAPQEEFSLNLLITDENGKAKFIHNRRGKRREFNSGATVPNN